MAVNLRLDWCSYQAAKYAVINYHYSKRMPRYKQVYIGVWEDGQFKGVIIFGLSICPHLGNAFNIKSIEVAELTRIALKEHHTPVSKLCSVALRMIKKQSPGLRLIVSYADSMQGHNGAIYQAGNWVYIGEYGQSKQYYFRGAWRNDSSMFRLFRDHPEVKRGITTRELPPKYKYLYPLDDAMRKQIEQLRKPYPKRQKDSSEPLDDQSKEGGAAPTLTLQ